MSDRSHIEWTDATWNPVIGCSRVSSGCANCYAARMAHRLAGMALHARGNNLTLPRYIGLTHWCGTWTGKIHCVTEALDLPLRWRKPRRVFVCSMGDLFHECVPVAFLDQVFSVIQDSPRHTFSILTKRPDLMRAYIRERVIVDRADPNPDVPRCPLPNVWLGVSVENQQYANERVPLLLGTPAAVRYVSCEPLLGPVDISRSGVDWVIAGGESGPYARPAHPDWFRSLRDQCAETQTPFFFKQWGEYNEAGQRVGKKAAGRLLDGKEFNEYPYFQEDLS